MWQSGSPAATGCRGVSLIYGQGWRAFKKTGKLEAPFLFLVMTQDLLVTVNLTADKSWQGVTYVASPTASVPYALAEALGLLPSQRTLKTPSGTVSSSGVNTIVDISAQAGYVSGNRIKLKQITLQSSASVVVLLQTTTGTPETLYRIELSSGSPGVAYLLPDSIDLPTLPDGDLVLNLSAAETVSYSIWYELGE